MKLILNWSKQQWLGMDAYQKSAVNFDRTLFLSAFTLLSKPFFVNPLS